MLSTLLNKQHYCIGLDVDYPSIVGSLVKKTKDQYELIDYCEIGLTNKFKYSTAISKLLTRFNHKKHPIVIGMAMSQVMIESISLSANLLEPEIMQYLTENAKRLFGYPSNQLQIDFSYLNSTEEQGAKINIMAIAVRHRNINYWSDLCKRAHVKLKAIDLNAFGLIRALPFCSEYHIDEITALALISFEGLTFCVLKQQQLTYLKEEKFLQPTSQQWLPTLRRAIHCYHCSPSNHNFDRLIVFGKMANLQEQLTPIADELKITLNCPTFNVTTRPSLWRKPESRCVLRAKSRSALWIPRSTRGVTSCKQLPFNKALANQAPILGASVGLALAGLNHAY